MMGPSGTTGSCLVFSPPSLSDTAPPGVNCLRVDEGGKGRAEVEPGTAEELFRVTGEVRRGGASVVCSSQRPANTGPGE